MTDARLIWCHGYLSRPWGAKSLALAETAKGFGLTMEGPDFSDLENPDLRAELLAGMLEGDDRPAILAGSSMGAYVAATAGERAAGLFLLAPAVYLPGYAVHVFSNLPGRVTVIHGWDDETVPVDNGIRFARTHRADLHVLADNHRLERSTPELCALFARFLTDVLEAARP